MPDLPRYHRQIAAARQAALQLEAATESLLLDLLRRYADELLARIRAGLRRGDEVGVLRTTRALVEELIRDLAFAVGRSVRLTTDRVAELHARATLTLTASTGLTGVEAAFAGVGVEAAIATLRRPELGASFRTIQREHAAAVREIIQRGILRGAPSAAIEMELRAHILGAEAIPGRLLTDRRRIGRRTLEALGYDPTAANVALVRRQANRVASKARLIARTEPMVAEHEAGVRAAARSPVVAHLGWRLSSRHEVEDECDLLQDLDWYGLGPGVFDPRKYPARPHPRDLCRREHLMLPESRWGAPRPPLPALKLDPEAEGEAAGLSPSRVRSLVRAIGTAEESARLAA